MSLESSIKDVISKKLEDGTVESLIAEQLEIGIKNALKDLLGSYGDVTKVIEKQVKSVMMTGKSYRELLVDCGYTEAMVVGMTEDDFEAEYVELALTGEQSIIWLNIENT